MRIAILTTDTLHHAYFIREIAASYSVGLVLNETTSGVPSFPTQHDFEQKRDAFELDKWFDGISPKLTDYADSYDVESVNSKEAQLKLDRFEPDAVIVFGTGKISPDTIALCRGGIMNLHGGDPEYYRGLDSHLWAIYHSDFSGLVTTLHQVNPSLDDGDIIAKQALDIPRGTPLDGLRKINTEACVTLSLTGLGMMERFGRFVSSPQLKKGRYYSFMPTVLKENCVKKFGDYFG